MSIIAMTACAHVRRPLDGTAWKLVEWSVSSQHAAATGITAKFSNDRISGSSGVNSYDGPCKAAADGAFSVGPLQSTEMAGPEPAMRAEGAYMTLLGQASSYTMTGGKLTLYGKGGNESLIFEPEER
ncbi:MAG: META domain-containing protein [Lysobacter sp.]|nr:META domain-containing protein [Lysobacter sp.]